MTLAYIGLGGNLGDPRARIREALRRIEERGLGRVTAVSSFWRTEPVGFTDQPWFVNGAAEIETALAPAELMTGLLAIERELGRSAERAKDGPRPIDLDLLIYGDAVIDEPGLTTPHPRMHRRRFALAPLGEIAPGLRHPRLRSSIAELLVALTDPERVERAEPIGGPG